MSNLDRTITVRLTIKYPELAKLIWESHINPDILIAGCRVGPISDGDTIKERMQMEEYHAYLVDEGIFEDGKVMEFEEWNKLP
jgi:hypothetical protein